MLYDMRLLASRRPHVNTNPLLHGLHTSNEILKKKIKKKTQNYGIHTQDTTPPQTTDIMN